MGAVRRKVSLSLPSALLAEVDRAVAAHRYPTRSAAVEASLAGWVRENRDAEIESYYRSLDAGQRVESEAWAELGYEALEQSTRHEPELPPRPRRRARRRRAVSAAR